MEEVILHGVIKKAVCLLLVVLVHLMYAPQLSAASLSLLTNQQRSEAGLLPLTDSPELMHSARNKAEHMFEQQYWSHDAPDGTTPWDFIRNTSYEYAVAGENLAKDFTTDEDVMRALMDSDAHRKNILEPRFTEIGIAKVDGVFEGRHTTIIVFHYAQPKSSTAFWPVFLKNSNHVLRDLVETQLAVAITKPS